MFSVGQIQQSGEVGNNSTFQLPIFCEMFLSKNIKILRRVLELQLEMSGILFSARCYASAVLAMGLCLSVCLSVTSRCSIETAERIEPVFGM